jgi:hypothetical protein
MLLELRLYPITRRSNAGTGMLARESGQIRLAESQIFEVAVIETPELVLGMAIAELLTDPCLAWRASLTRGWMVM